MENIGNLHKICTQKSSILVIPTVLETRYGGHSGEKDETAFFCWDKKKNKKPSIPLIAMV